MAKTETKRERSIRNKSEYASRKASGKEQVKEKEKESGHVGKTPVPSKEDVGFWDNFFSKIESGETVYSFAVSHGMTDQVLRDRLRRGELHERYIEAHQGRAVYHAHSIEGLVDRLEAGEIESDVARVSIDARKWLATKYFPRMFGERQEVNLKTTDMTKVYVEQLKILMSNQEQRVRTIEVKSEVKLVTEEKDDTEGE
jgi:hypothetical protein